jgi:hypothetical protein
VPGDETVARWIVNKLKDDSAFISVTSTGSGFLEVARKGFDPFTAVAIGVREVVRVQQVAPLFEVEAQKPEFVVSVPSSAVWSGDAIGYVHDVPAAFGTLGDLVRASGEVPVSTYRNKQYAFFQRVFSQHTEVLEVTRLYDRLFRLHRTRGLPDVTVVLVDAYDVSAEDVRNVRAIYGQFDAAVKITGYGSITTAAREAAASIGASVFTLKELMGRLRKR